MPPKRVLQLGLALDGGAGPAWIAALLTRVIQSEHTAITQVFFTGARRHRPSLFAALYGAVDRAIFSLKNDALATLPFDALLAGITSVEIRSAQDWTDAHNTLAQLDLLLDLSSGPVPSALPCAIWHYSQAMRQGLAGLAEVVQRRPVSCGELCATAHGKTYSLYRSWSGTHNLSARRNRQRLYWKAHAFAAQRLGQLAQAGPEHFYRRYATAPEITPPTRPHLWRYLPAFKWHWWRQAFSDFFYRGTWHVHCGPCTELPENFAALSPIQPTPNT